MTRQLHLTVTFLDPGGVDVLDHGTSLARKAEEATLDAVVLGDGTEPTTALALMAGCTEFVGLIGSLSPSANDPVELARRLGDLDLISGGRVGWNVETTGGPVAPLDAADHVRAARVVDQVLASWTARAGSRSRAALRSPQGRPVIVRAGGAGDGRALASRGAEVLVSPERNLGAARTFRHEVRSGARRFGRRPEDVVVLSGLSAVIGSTESEAAARWALLDDSARARFGGRIVVGTPEQIADDLERWFRAGGADGFSVASDLLPSGFADFVDHVVPELRRRGLFRHEYSSRTLRGHLGLAVPQQSAAPHRRTPLVASA